MHSTLTVLLGVLATLISAAPAQVPPETGRLPLLADLPARGGRCRAAAASGALLRSGHSQVMSWTGGSPERLVGITVDSAGRPRSLNVMMSVPAGGRTRREGESISAFLDARGRVERGDRRFYTLGTPARLSEDRRGGLLPGDSARALVLARAVAARCRA
jgi:hypothetical protein